MKAPPEPLLRDRPLGGRAYGSIPHLPGSRTGPSDRTVSPAKARICTEQARPGDRIVVQEKLDGSCVCVARIGDAVLALGREGSPAAASRNESRRLFAAWVDERRDRFLAALDPGERLAGEWLAMAHGTRYRLVHEPFVAFDVLRGHDRLPFDRFHDRALRGGFTTPWVLHDGGAVGPDRVLALLGEGRHGAVGPAEGAVWRVEREVNGALAVDFLAKLVRPEKVDGMLLAESTGGAPIWNWRP